MNLNLILIGDEQTLYRYRVQGSHGWGDWIFCTEEKFFEIKSFIKVGMSRDYEVERLSISLEERATNNKDYIVNGNHTHNATDCYRREVQKKRNYALSREQRLKKLEDEELARKQEEEKSLPKYETLHDRLMYLRGGITYKAIADKVGLSTSQLRRIFSGRSTAKPEVISKLAAYFRVPLDYLTEARNG